MTKKLKNAYPSPKITEEEKYKLHEEQQQIKKKQKQIKKKQQLNKKWNICKKKYVNNVLKTIEKDKNKMVNIKSEMENIRTAHNICENYTIKKEYRVLIMEKEKELRIMCKKHYGYINFDLDGFPNYSHKDEHTNLCTICGL